MIRSTPDLALVLSCSFCTASQFEAKLLWSSKRASESVTPRCPIVYICDGCIDLAHEEQEARCARANTATPAR